VYLAIERKKDGRMQDTWLVSMSWISQKWKAKSKIFFQLLQELRSCTDRGPLHEKIHSEAVYQNSKCLLWICPQRAIHTIPCIVWCIFPSHFGEKTVKLKFWVTFPWVWNQHKIQHFWIPNLILR
jgi:hypothetical protein